MLRIFFLPVLIEVFRDVIFEAVVIFWDCIFDPFIKEMIVLIYGLVFT